MAFGHADNKRKSYFLLAEMNVVPLIDIMVVLMVIFMTTSSLFTSSLNIALPQVSVQQSRQVQSLPISIDAQGQLFLDEKIIPFKDLQSHLAAIVATSPSELEVQLRADLNTRYETLAKVMGALHRVGLTHISFITTF